MWQFHLKMKQVTIGPLTCPRLEIDSLKPKVWTVHSGTWSLIRGYNEYFLTIFWQTSSSVPNKKFHGPMVRRPAFHTVIWGFDSPCGQFCFFLGDFRFYSLYPHVPLCSCAISWLDENTSLPKTVEHGNKRETPYSTEPIKSLTTQRV